MNISAAAQRTAHQPAGDPLYPYFLAEQQIENVISEALQRDLKGEFSGVASAYEINHTAVRQPAIVVKANKTSGQAGLADVVRRLDQSSREVENLTRDDMSRFMADLSQLKDSHMETIDKRRQVAWSQRDMARMMQLSKDALWIQAQYIALVAAVAFRRCGLTQVSPGLARSLKLTAE